MVPDAARRVDLLQSKRAAMRFQILAEVADRQPAVSQQEIADALGITNQAVSEYLRTLVDEGHVHKGGRGRYEVTKEGVDWLFAQSEALEAYLTYLTEEVLGSVELETAIASAPIDEGDPVSLSMVDGVLHAAPGEDADGGSAVAVTAAAAGEEVGITDWRGVIEYDLGSVTVLSIPTVRAGGSRRVDDGRLDELAGSADLVAAAGTEAVAALRRVGRHADITYGTPEAVKEAAARGLDVLLVSVTTRVAEHVERLRELDIEYEVVEPGSDTPPAS